MDEPTLSIVIAAWPSQDGLDACLASLDNQRSLAHEILVVFAASSVQNGAAHAPWVRWLEADADALIPHLWQRGIEAATGHVVAITTAQFVPAPDWVARIRDAHARLQSSAIGGAIDPPYGGSTVDWAAYFLRYSRYSRYENEQTVSDIAGDNASYQRDHLEAHRTAMVHGFWEPDFHRLILAEGRKIYYTPRIRVAQRAGMKCATFFRQRFQHGRQFGQGRVRDRSLALRTFRVATAPLIPLVLLVKIGRQVIQARHYVLAFAYALPALTLFVGAWSLGECSGYVLCGHRESGAEHSKRRSTST